MKRSILALLATVALAGPAWAQERIDYTAPASTATDLTASSTLGTAYGADMVTNGTFTGNATGWTLGGAGGAPDWAYATNNVTHANGGGTAALEPSTPLTVVAGRTYRVTFVISGLTAGTVSASIGGASGTAAGTNGTFVQTMVAVDTTNLKFTPTTTLVATIDTVSVVESQSVTVANLTAGRIPYAATSGRLTDSAGLTYDEANRTLSVTALNAGALGTNQVTNGTFTGNATGWTLGAGGGAPDWAYATNNVTHASGGGTTALQPSTPLTVTVGTRYGVLFILSSYASGTITPGIGGATGGAVNFNTSVYAANAWYEVLTATTTGNLILTPSNDFAGTIDGIEVYPLTLAPPSFSVKPVSGSLYPNEFRVHGSSNGSSFMGYQSGEVQTSGTFNHAIGSLALKAITAGVQNIAMGTNALNTSTAGSFNTALGTGAMRLARVGSRNVAVGTEALNLGLGYEDNTAVGYQSGNAVGIGSNNSLFGALTAAATFSYCHAFGYGATCTAGNQGVFGGATAGAGMTEAYWGHGVNKASPGTFSFRGTGGSGSNNAAGDFEVAAGLSTGTGKVGQVILSSAVPVASGATAQTKIQREFVGAVLVVSNNTATTAGTFTCASDSVCGTIVEYGVEVNDGASHHQQVEQGIVTCNVSNTNGTFAQGGTSGCTKSSNVQHVSASGGSTLTVTWTMTGANPALLQVNANSGLTPATGFPRITYTVKNMTNQAVTVP